MASQIAHLKYSGSSCRAGSRNVIAGLNGRDLSGGVWATNSAGFRLPSGSVEYGGRNVGFDLDGCQDYFSSVQVGVSRAGAVRSSPAAWSGNTDQLRSRRSRGQVFRGLECVGHESTSVGAASSLVGNLQWRQVDGKRITGGCRGGALMSRCLYGMSTETIRWGMTAACTLLLLSSNPGARKQFLVPILTLEAPADVVTWIKSEYGLWVGFVGLTLRIFYTIPLALDFPLAVYLFLAMAPASAATYRGTLGGTVVSTTLACLCAFQYFSYNGGLSSAFRRDRIVNTIAILFMTIACIGFFSMLAM